MSETPRIQHKQKRPPVRPHGWIRASDLPTADDVSRELRKRMSAPAGTSLLMFLCIAVLTGMGVVKVHASTRVLAAGGEISQRTEEQRILLEEKRRLSAERAYLRHPDTIQDVARDRLGMIPIAPELVQEIRLLEEEAR